VRAVSTVVATLIVVSIAIGLSVFAISFAASFVSKAAAMPNHLELVEASARPLGGGAYVVSIVYYNPSRDATFTASTSSYTLYRSGFSTASSLSGTYASCTLQPGAYCKLEFAVFGAQQPGVLRVDVSVSRQGTSYSYTDKILLPLS